LCFVGFQQGVFQQRKFLYMISELF
jgi:hypothetical protein